MGQDDLELKPCYALHRFLATQPLLYIFGHHSVESATKKCAHGMSIKRKAPKLSVYIISAHDDAACEQGIEHLFAEIAVNLWKLRNSDFFTPDEGMVPSMNIEGLAALYACKTDYNAPVLFINAGAAITYSALDEKGHLMGGGVCPGLSVRFRTLFEYCSADDTIPLIDYETYKKVVNEASMAQKPIPFFSSDAQTGIIASVVSELSGQLRNIIKQFIGQVIPDNNTCGEANGCTRNNNAADDDAGIHVNGDQNSKRYVANKDSNALAAGNQEEGSKGTEGETNSGDTSGNLKTGLPVAVVISGSDSDVLKPLLNEDCSKIIDLEPGVTFPTESTAIFYRKSMPFYGIEQMLLYNLSKISDPDHPNPDDELRERIVGLRAAKGVTVETSVGETTPSSVQRGTIVGVVPGKTIDDDMYQIMYDGDVCKSEYVDLVGLYGRSFGSRPFWKLS